MDPGEVDAEQRVKGGAHVEGGSVGRNGRKTTLTQSLLEMSRKRPVASRSWAPLLACRWPSLNQ
jgi:hypothetical protein